MKTIFIGTLTAILDFIMLLFNLVAYSNNGRLINLVFAIIFALLLVVAVWVNYRLAKALDKHIEAISQTQSFTLDTLEHTLSDMQLLAKYTKEISEKVCNLQNNSITLQSEDKGRPSPAE